MIGLIGRVPTTVSLYEFARHAGGGFNLFTFFGLTVKLCPGLQNTYTDGCDNMWLEAAFQGSRDQNRIALSQVLADAERKVADYVGYWPGPQYIENERHFMAKGWDNVIRTNYMKVPISGTRKRTLLFSGAVDGSGSVPMTREFISVFQPNLANVIRYKFGEIGTSLNLPDDCSPLLYPQGIDELALSSGDLDIEKTINEAYRLRPFVVVERTDEFLTIDVPLVVAVKPELYFSQFPDIKGNTRFMDACDEDNFIDRIAVYGETFEKPDGYVKIAKRFCSCGGGGCDECSLPELPICLIPVSSEEGFFQVRPIRNTGTEESPCWIVDDLESCCDSLSNNLKSGRTFDQRWATNCFCTKPLELCINYISSCNNCFGDDCLDRIVCPALLNPIVGITLSRLPIWCDCTCFREVIARLRDEYALRTKGLSRGSVSGDFEQYALGNLVGEVEAYLSLMHVVGKHRTPRIGMVG